MHIQVTPEHCSAHSMHDALLGYKGTARTGSHYDRGRTLVQNQQAEMVSWQVRTFLLDMTVSGLIEQGGD